MLTLLFTVIGAIIWLTLYICFVLPAMIVWFVLTLPLRPLIGNVKTNDIQIRVKIVRK